MIDQFRSLFGGTAPTGQIEYIVAGLGNPGKEYQITRHNAGFLAVDYIADKRSFSIGRLKFKSLSGDTMLAGKRVLFLKPSTFMNNSGEALREAMAFYKVPANRVIVLFDDISLPVGAMRIRRKGSDGGQKGMQNIIYLTGREDFPRIKIGIGKKPYPDMNLADWVLSRFTQQELTTLDTVWPKALDAVELMVQGQVDEAMNRYNGG